MVTKSSYCIYCTVDQSQNVPASEVFESEMARNDFLCANQGSSASESAVTSPLNLNFRGPITGSAMRGVRYQHHRAIINRLGRYTVTVQMIIITCEVFCL